MRLWRHAVLGLALFGTSVVVVSCGTTPTRSVGTGSTKQTGSTIGTASGSGPATGAAGVDALCADVYVTQTTLDRTKIVPAADAQKILADSQSSGNAKLESEASTLASASHVVDQAGTAAALAAMVATCHAAAAKP